MELAYRCVPFELKAADRGSGEFEGYASVFHTIDDSAQADIVCPGAFQADLPEFLASGFIGGMNHDWSRPIGRPLEAREDAHGLFVRAALSDTTDGRDLRTLLADGVVRRLSIGFRILEREWLETADAVQAHWRRWGYVPTPEDAARAPAGARLLKRIRLYEVSPVALAANPMARITGVKRASAEAPPAYVRAAVQRSRLLGALGG